MTGYYITCPLCGGEYGRMGKGIFGARHECDSKAYWLRAFFRAGVELQMCADVMGWTYEQAQIALRAAIWRKGKLRP